MRQVAYDSKQDQYHRKYRHSAHGRAQRRKWQKLWRFRKRGVIFKEAA